MFNPANMSNFCLCIAAVIRLSFLKSAAKIYNFHEPTMAFCHYISGVFSLYTLCIKSQTTQAIFASDSKKSIEFCIKHNFCYGIGDFTIITNKILSIFLYLCMTYINLLLICPKDINRIKVVLVEGSDVMYIKMPK